MTRAEYITVVSGLPRSGTSMMMSMLQAGGIEPLTDGLRTADEDNPRGYYEFERAKKIKEDTAWLADARGKAVKLISQLLLGLPPNYHYKIIFMRRDMAEVLASQRQMLIRRGTAGKEVDDAEMGPLLARHVEQVLSWTSKQPNIELISIDYNETVRSPAPSVERINQFLGGDLGTTAMMEVADRNLYRQRAG